MDSVYFRKAAKELGEYIAEYRDNIHKYRVIPDVQPGFLQHQIPTHPPEKPESWNEIMKDLDTKIMPGMSHWKHPYFFAYFPSAASYSCILADMLTGALASNATSWAACPAATELETITMDWLGRAMNLPKHFIFSEPGSSGGGILLTSASESNLVSLLAARAEALRYLRREMSSSSVEQHDSAYLGKMVAYCSKEAHSSIEKAAMIALVKLRILDVDENSVLRGETLQKAMKEDMTLGFMPFYVAATLGTTGCTSFDNLVEIGPIVQKLPCCWLHCDGAYGGASFICPEMREPMEGLHYADSFNCNANKWLLVNFEACGFWIKDRNKLAKALVDNHLCSNPSEDDLKLEYRHWGIPLGRKFKALKVWFALRNYGLQGLQENIRNQCALAKELRKMILADERFEVVNQVKAGLVCLRLRGPDTWTEALLDDLNTSGLLHVIPSKVQNKYCIRLAVNNENVTKKHIDKAWGIIQRTAGELLPFVHASQKRRTSSVMSLTKEIPLGLLSSRRESLTDFATPIEILEEINSGTSSPNNSEAD